MEPPSLSLVIIQGPREGESFEFRPGSTIRIGRVIRGNNLPIKDAGISSKHILIGSESGKWTVQDLDSSNGTSLNATQLPPFKAFDLRHNDTVKLGESTSILVQIKDHYQTSQLRRNPRRGGGGGAAKLGPFRDNPGQTAIGSKENNVSGQVEEEAVVIHESRRKGRSRKKKEINNVAPMEMEPIELRRTRGRKDDDCVLVENPEEKCKKTRGGGRKRQNLHELPLEEELQEVCDSEDDRENREGMDLDEFESKKTRRGRGRRQDLQELLSEDVMEVYDVDDEGNKEGLNFDSEKFKSKKAHKGIRNKKKLWVPQEDVKEVEVGGDVKENKEGLDVEKDGVEGGTKVAKEGEVKSNARSGDVEKECEEAATENVEQIKAPKLGQQQEKMDLEKMTLGQWFDYMEEHLPRQIIEVTEEMILGMRRKAERVKEYMMEQKGEKGVKVVG